MQVRKCSGLLYAYYFICKRKIWYCRKGISLEEEDENVLIGKLIDEESYSRERKHILIDDYTNIDFMKDRTVFEVKKSTKQKEAAINQIKYYLYVLNQKNVNIKNGELRVPAEKYVESVVLTEEDISEIETRLREIEEICACPVPPKCINDKICRSCAYFELCYI